LMWFVNSFIGSKMAKHLAQLSIFIVAAGLFSCGTADKNPIKEANFQTDGPKSIIVDYKSDSYRIALGEHYGISDNIVDWGWAGLNDEDNVIDSTGKDSYLSLGEPLLKFNGRESLPALFIETDKNIIISFTMSMLFDLEDYPNQIDAFLKILSNDVARLRDGELVESLKRGGSYQIDSPGCVEIYELKQNMDIGYDRFSYTITAK
jgi:hypothetical protein